jgi:hypothetical protein
MAKEFDYLAAARAASDKPQKDSPGLDPTASRYLSDARYLFANMIESCGYPIAKHIFQKCIKEGAEIEAKKEKRVVTAQRRAKAPPIDLPPIAKQNAMSREDVCKWWIRFADTEQPYDERARHLWSLYQAFGGQPEGFNPHLPPIKRKGAKTRNAVNAQLPAMFDETNPESDFSIWKAKRNGRGTKEQFADLQASRPGKKHGPTADAVLHNERNWRKKKRKV